jgi:hypothetical protein
MPEDSKRLDTERKRWNKGYVTDKEYERFKKKLESQSRAKYDELYPRRPEWWDKVIEAYLQIPPEDRAGFGRDEIQRLIDCTNPAVVKEERAQEKRQAEKRKDAKRVRNLPENKKQQYDHKYHRNWQYTDEVDSSGRPIIITRNRKGSVYHRWYSSWFSRFVDYLDRKINRDKYDPNAIQSSWNTEKLAGGDGGDDAPHNSDEFSGRYGFGFLPPPGKKKSGNTRKLLGEK